MAAVTFDTPAGLHYHRARSYSFEVARLVNVDAADHGESDDTISSARSKTVGILRRISYIDELDKPGTVPGRCIVKSAWLNMLENQKMPNGKGTPACGYCRHCLMYGVNVSDRESHGICTLWNAGIPPYRASFDEQDDKDLLLPPQEFRNLNMICKDYDADRQRLPNGLVGRLCPKVRKTLLRGLLYAAPYNVIEDPSEYDRVVCILDKELGTKPDVVKITDSWMEEYVEQFIGKHVNVRPLPMLQALWDRIDNDRIVSVSQADTYGKQFRIRIQGFWDYLGKRYGGIGRVDQEGHILDAFWIVFSVSRVDTFNFSDPKHRYHITVGPEKPVFWRNTWPLLDNGSPRLKGIANIRT